MIHTNDIMSSFPDSISEKVFQINPAIRFVGIFHRGELHYSYKEGITPYIDEDKTKKSLEQAVKRWNERKELFGTEIGNPIYSITMYELVKRMIIELKDGSILLLSTELEVDHEKLLLNLMEFKDSMTK